MKIPGFIKGKANAGNKVAQAFIQMYDNGDNTPYDPEAYASLKVQMQGAEEDYQDYEMDVPREEDFTPEEQKANDRIEELGDKYRLSDKQANLGIKDEDEAIDAYDKMMAENKDPHIDEQLNKIKQEEVAHKEYLEEVKKNPNAVYEDPDEELYEELADNEYIYGNLDKEHAAKVLSERKGIDVDKAADYIEKNFNEHFWDEEMFKGNPYNPEKLPDEGLSQEELDNKQKSNWYDNLSDESEHAKAYKDKALAVNPERAALIAKAMEDYVGEKPQRGFITNEQLKKYGEQLGLPKMSDRDLRLMWDDVNNVGGYKSFGTPYDKGGRELEDARSAFTEVVNEEARNRKAKGNYFPYNEEDIEEAKNKIADIARPYEGYDADSYKGYMTTQDLDKVERIANAYHITDEDLEKLSRMFSKYNYPGRGWKGNK